jgi:lipopolysaccharide transport system ATP-binding protein
MSLPADIAVRAEGIGKEYQLGQTHGGYQLLSEKITDRLRRREGRDHRSEREFWALRDVGFEVRQGETFGVIGHNGAGKSTLLKILSRVTPPTTGSIQMRGRVGALLEVGTGFNPELTGRENVFLNGAILGMRRTEIVRKFDEIVEFAELERFMETPVKRYSSGMYMRLAFSVAAHLEPEIRIVDEVLSVGDSRFQEKCLGRMETVSREGRTVLFVSHNLAAVRKLCDRAVLLSGGQTQMIGPTNQVIDRYLEMTKSETLDDLGERSDRQGNGRLKFNYLRLETASEDQDSPVTGEDVKFVLGYTTADSQPLAEVNIAVSISTAMNELMLYLNTGIAGVRLQHLPASGEICCELPRCPLPPGSYSVNLWADSGGEPLDWVQRAAHFTVQDGDFFGSGQSSLESHPAVLVEQGWSVSERGNPE